MWSHLTPSHPELHGQFREYLSQVEPLVASTASKVGKDRAFLGTLCDLLPSRPCSIQHFTRDDWAWMAALERVIHVYGVSYELITHTGGVDSIWLVPPH